MLNGAVIVRSGQDFTRDYFFRLCDVTMVFGERDCNPAERHDS